MSVLACDRAFCSEVMCDRMILDGSQYICDRCWKELLEYKATWPRTMAPGYVRRRIEEFMVSAPGSFKVPVNTDEEFDRLTQGPRDDDE